MNQLFSLFEKSSDAAIAIDKKQHIVFWNRTAETLLGYPQSEVKGRPCWQLLNGRTRGHFPFCQANCPIVRQIRTEQSAPNIDLTVNTRTGLSLPVNASTIPVAEGKTDESQIMLIHLFRPLPTAENMFGTFRLYFLGPLRAQRLDGSLVNSFHWQNLHVRALLVYLAQQEYVPVTEERLAADLWPDLPPSIAQTELETAVTHLRLCLEPNLALPQHSRYILFQDGRYAFNSEIPLWIDIQHVAQKGKQASLEPNIHHAIQIYEEILRLFRGEYLVDLGETAVWSQNQYLHARQLHIHTLESLGQLYEQINQPEEAKKLYLSALMLDVNCDTAYQKLIQLALPHSSRIEALQHCQHLASTIRSELDIILSDEFRQLLEKT
ncbi:MAG: PAS domain S-box protein [Ardenticatenaceae bacterium]|nr:PAS domain S-box protein [Anaerolineales bacterium]MCB8921564.1 PAS domain S-box protein [Ardenticatenaceae bacterium]MCB8991481.1 PAS domain S-box protein [Ardenticatenaceae bacterium]MCB9003899.1 PAS domain S-box protein [Ardenticatenaceae bacterium]